MVSFTQKFIKSKEDKEIIDNTITYKNVNELIQKLEFVFSEISEKIEEKFEE